MVGKLFCDASGCGTCGRSNGSNSGRCAEGQTTIVMGPGDESELKLRCIRRCVQRRCICRLTEIKHAMVECGKERASIAPPEFCDHLQEAHRLVSGQQ